MSTADLPPVAAGTGTGGGSGSDGSAPTPAGAGAAGVHGGDELGIAPIRWWQLSEIADLEARIFAEDAWSEELFWSELAQAETRHYVAATTAGRIVGYAGLAVHGDESFVQTLGVVAERRRAGVATRLLVRLLRHARAAGAHSCGLEVRTDNTPARRLYRRLGFVDLGVRRGYYQPSGADAFVMRVRPIDTPGYKVLLDQTETEARR